MAYHQIPMQPSEEEKLAFSTQNVGLYLSKLMLCGRCNAVSTFRRIIEAAASWFQWHIAVLYPENIIVYWKSFGEPRSDLCVLLYCHRI